MDAVVYIGHGSRMVEGTRHFMEFMDKVKKEINIPIQEIAFLELTSPSIHETMEKIIFLLFQFYYLLLLILNEIFQKN